MDDSRGNTGGCVGSSGGRWSGGRWTLWTDDKVQPSVRRFIAHHISLSEMDFPRLVYSVRSDMSTYYVLRYQPTALLLLYRVTGSNVVEWRDYFLLTFIT